MELKYTKEEAENMWNAFEQSLVVDRYAIRDPKSGKPLETTYSQVKERISPELSMPVANAIHSNSIITATPILMFLGNNYSNRKGYFSCYPMGDVKDSTKSIFDMERRLVTIFQHAGGGGIDVSNLRSKGTPVDNGQGEASGPVSFAKGFAQLSQRISQGGKRRGALMIQMDYTHADRDEFITFKSESNGQFAGCNVSLNITDDKFWEDTDLIDDIAHQIWKCGDPGLLFTTKHVANTPVPAEHNPVFSNPCGEYLSTKDTACNLITVNLQSLFKTKNLDFYRYIDEVRKLGKIACIAGNEILDMPEGLPPIPAVQENTKKFRPVGVGMTGLHMAMNQFDIAYTDPKAAPLFAQMTQAALMLGSMEGSMEYGASHNVKYELKIVPWSQPYTYSLEGRLMQVIESMNDGPIKESFLNRALEVFAFIRDNGGLYNSVTTSQAPTGSTSQMLHVGCTSIEPYYEMETKRKYVDTSKYDGSMLEATLVPLEFYDYTKEKLDWVEEQTAHKVSPMQQIAVLSAIQDFCHTAVSKTINLPAETSVDEIRDILMYVKDTNLKGITMFRDSSMEGILSSDSSKAPVPVEGRDFADMWRRTGETIKFKNTSDQTKMYVTVNKGSLNHIREIFMNTKWAGPEGHAMAEALGRVISIALQKDHTLLPDIIQSLQEVSADSTWTCPDLKGVNDGARLDSIPQAIAATLEVLNSDVAGVKLHSSYSECPNCNKKAYRRNGGCGICTECGYSSC